MTTRLRLCSVLIAHVLILMLLAACGSSPADSNGGQGNIVPDAVGTAPVVYPPSGVQTRYPVVLPYAQPSTEALRSRPTLTPPPTVDPVVARDPRGDTPEADAIVKQWMHAAKDIRSLHGSQNFALINPDGSRESDRHDIYQGKVSTDEWYDGLETRDGKLLRYRVVVHNEHGDFTTLYDGKGAYRTWSWLKEVYRPWPDGAAFNAYWHDDIDSTSILYALYPEASTSTTYELVGRKELDGRKVIELREMDGSGTRGNEVYLDEVTYLPYRFIQHPRGAASSAPSYEITFSKLEINGPVGDADFKLNLPADTVTIYEHTHWGPQMPIYSTVSDAHTAAGFAFFEPQSWAPQEIKTLYYVERDSKLSPVLFMSQGDASILQGLYLPITDQGDRFALQFDSNVGMQDVQVTKVDIDGQPAEWVIGKDSGGRGRLRLSREGTQIEIRISTLEKAIETARILMRVR